jgi:hypothetical protein
VTLLRRHALLAGLLAAGLALRVLALVAYHPALIYVDTLKYLYGLYPGSEPLGYAALLRVVLLAGDLGAVAVVQHLLGLAVAVALYAVLLRRGAPRWLAALAVAPVLLDAYQVQMEQMIMPEALFEAVVVAGLVVLLWRPAVSVTAAVAAGLVLGASAAVKQIGLVLIIPAVAYLLVSCRSWRRSAIVSGALIVAFLLPVVGYCTFSYARTGHFWLARRQPFAGRLAAAADCATLRLPASVRPICPTPAEQALGPDWLEHSGQSPLFSVPVKPGTRGALISELNSAVVHQQPLRVAAAIVRDAVRLFAPTRTASLSVTPISRWQFQTSYPTFPPWVRVSKSGEILVGLQSAPGARFSFHVLRPSYGGRARVNRPLAAWLRSYQLDGGYTPGPLLALCVLAGLGGSAVALIRRIRGAADDGALSAVLLFTATAAFLLLLPDLYQFTWRYQLPALLTLPPAAALAVSALIAQRRARVSSGGVMAGQSDPDRREDLLGRPGARSQAGGESAG